MAISVPGRIERGFLSRRVHRGKAAPALSLTSLIDVLVVTLVFLLMTFSASDECGCRRDLRLPMLDSGLEMIDAPIVSISAREILVEGVPAGDTQAVANARGVQRVDELFQLLKAKRDTWRQLHPGRDFPGHVVLAVDADVPSGVVKSVVHTAAHSGYPSIDFMVATR